MEKLDAGRFFAYLGAGGGFGLSLWANVRDAYIPEIPVDVDPVLWRAGYPGFHEIDPTAFDLVISGFFPVALFIALELLTRVRWNDSTAHRITRWVGVGLPAVVAGFISYSHLKTAMLLGGASEQLASLGPLAVDGFMLLCSVVLLMTGKHSNKTVNTPPMNTPAAPSPTVQPVPLNTALNTSQQAVQAAAGPAVQPTVSAVQSTDEHLNTEPVNTEMNTSTEVAVNTDETVQVNAETEPVNTIEEPVNTPEPKPVNTTKKTAAKKVNTPKAKPVNTDRVAELNTARELLAEGKSVRDIATTLNISVGKASGLKKEIEAGGPVTKPAKKAEPVADEVDLDLVGPDFEAGLEKLLAGGDDDTSKEA